MPEYLSPTRGTNTIQNLTINFEFDPKAKEYKIAITKVTPEETVVVSSVTLYDFFTVKSHIDDVLKREGYNP